MPWTVYNSYEEDYASFVQSLFSKGGFPMRTTTESNTLGDPSSGHLSTVTYTLTETSYPSFSLSTPTCYQGTPGCGRCFVTASSVRLIYWPVSTESGNPNSTITPTATGIVKAQENGTTFVSPSVYLSYENVWASADGCGLIGTSHPGALLTIDPSSLTSLEGPKAGDVIDGKGDWQFFRRKAFNYANLNLPAPDSVFMAQPDNQLFCKNSTTGDCDRRNYHPILAVPDEILTLDPSWKDCEMELYGSYDPPRALTPVDALVDPTSTFASGLSFSTAAPVPLITSQTVRPTSSPTTYDPATATNPVILPLSQDLSGDLGSSVLMPKSSSSNIISFKDPSSEGLPNERPTKDTAFGALPSKDPSSVTSPVMFPPNIDLSSGASSANEISGNGLSVDDPRSDVLTTSRPAPAFAITIGSHTYHADSEDRIQIGSTAISPDGPAMTISDQIISMNTQEIIVHSVSQDFFSTISIGPGISIASHVLSPGSAFTISETPVSLVPSASAVALGSYTEPSSQTTTLVSQDFFSAISISPGTPAAGHALTPGTAITISGTPISLAPSASAVVVGTHTERLSHATTFSTFTVGSLTLAADPTGGYFILEKTSAHGNPTTSSDTLGQGHGSNTGPSGPTPTPQGLGALIMGAFGNWESAQPAYTSPGNGTGAKIESAGQGNISYTGPSYTGGSSRGFELPWWAFAALGLGYCA